MDYKIKNLPKSRLEIKVVLDKNDVSKFRKLAIEEIGKNLKLDGFRKGHIPSDMIEKSVDPSHVKSELLNIAINHSFRDFTKKESIDVIGSPQIMGISEDPLGFTIEVDVYPKVDLGDYSNIKIKSNKIKVSEEEIDEQIEILKKNFSENKPKKGKLKKGDVAKVDFEGFDEDGNPVKNTKSSNFEMEIGSGKMIPGFEEELIGMTIGGEKDFFITFPKDYHVKQMAGVKYKFYIKVNETFEKVLPEINEEFVTKIYGSKKTVDFLRDDIKTHLKSNKITQENRRLEDLLLDSWSKMISFEVPQFEIDKKVEFMIDNIKLGILQQGMPWQHYLDKIGKKEDDVKKEVEPEAIENVRKSYIIQEIIKNEKITASEEEIGDRIKDIEFQSLQRGKKFDHENYKKGSKGYLNIASSILVYKVFDKYLPKVE